MLDQLWLALTGRSRRLLDLAELEANSAILAHTFVGRRAVPLSQIRGSVTSARCYDFDANFRLLQRHTQSRWQDISAARRRGIKLPPVVLLQVGDTYFVEDGHHRISVAKAYRDQEIEAEVTVLQLTEPANSEKNRENRRLILISKFLSNLPKILLIGKILCCVNFGCLLL